MECDICRTLDQQLRSCEMEVEDARKGSLSHGAGVTAGPLLDNALQESRKTRVLYQHHRDRFHKSARPHPAVQSGSRAAVMPGSLRPKVEQVMDAAPFWPDDLSALSNQAALNFMAENRAWNKRLRVGSAALVNTRLAKTITKEEYASRRKRSNQDTAECWRRASMLMRDMAARERGLVPFNDSSDLLN